MSLSETDLFLDRVSIPSLEAIVEKLASYGYAAEFPERFHFADDSHSFWLPVTLNGTETGFDYHTFEAASLGEDEPEYVSPHPGFGDTCLSFAARHDNNSVLAAALVQNAILELSDAKGFWAEGEESFDNAGMIAFLEHSTTKLKLTAVSSPKPKKAKKSRLPENYFRDVALGLIGFAATIAAISGLAYLAGMASKS